MRTWSNIHPDTRVVRIHSDMGGEFKSHFEKWCNDLGARKTGTGGYNSIQNPLGELFNRLVRARGNESSIEPSHRM